MIAMNNNKSTAKETLSYNQTNTYELIGQELHNYYEKVSSQIGFFGMLNESLAETHLCESNRLLHNLKDLSDKWVMNPDMQDADTYRKEIVIPYFFDVLKSLESRIELSKVGKFRDSKELFELSMLGEAIPCSAIEDVVPIYYKAVSDFLESQTEVAKLPLTRINIRNVEQYKRKSNSISERLDDLATELFKKKIFTPSNLDVKENNPHQFLGQINIGYHGFLAELVDVISHEGPFGHNTHDFLTEQNRSGFNFHYRHTSEGLAILGETLGLELYYEIDKKEELQPLITFMQKKRLVGDSLGCAFEKLAYYDKESSENIARSLASPYISEELLLQRLNGLENHRESNFAFGATPYYVGSQKVPALYESAMKKISSFELNKEKTADLKAQVLHLMYTGQRSVNIMEAEMKNYLSAQEKLLLKDNPITLPNVNGYK